jgi:predicted RNase H-like HicB family nuclease
MPYIVDSVEAYGRLTFTPKEETYPIFPDLKVLIFKEPEDNGVYAYTAVCIQLELDVCGNTVEEVKKELKRAIGLYFTAQARSCSSWEEFAKKILDNIYSTSKQKEELFYTYCEVKKKYIMSRAKKSTIQMPKEAPTSVMAYLFKKDTMRLSPVMG